MVQRSVCSPKHFLLSLSIDSTLTIYSFYIQGNGRIQEGSEAENEDHIRFLLDRDEESKEYQHDKEEHMPRLSSVRINAVLCCLRYFY